MCVLVDKMDIYQQSIHTFCVCIKTQQKPWSNVIRTKIENIFVSNIDLLVLILGFSPSYKQKKQAKNTNEIFIKNLYFSCVKYIVFNTCQRIILKVTSWNRPRLNVCIDRLAALHWCMFGGTSWRLLFLSWRFWVKMLEASL